MGGERLALDLKEVHILGDGLVWLCTAKEKG
jgi:hypothetical protein